MIDTQTFLEVGERFGVPVAFALLMVALLLYFTNLHRAERREWRDMMKEENQLTRNAISDLRKSLSELAESFAFLNGRLGRATKRK